MDSNEFIFISSKFVKFIDEETGEIGSHSIIYGDNKSKDFHGNFFTKKTNTGFFQDGKKLDVGLLNHRVPLFKRGQFDPETEKALKKISDMSFKNPVVTTVDDTGEFSKLVLDLSDKYEKMVFELAKKGVFKWSSGAAPQTYKALPSGELEMFVPVERSLTPIPAEYRMLEHRVMPLKAYTDFLGKESRKSSSIKNFFMSYSVVDSFEKSLKHYGPGDHKSGSSQEVHGGSGSAKPKQHTVDQPDAREEKPISSFRDKKKRPKKPSQVRQILADTLSVGGNYFEDPSTITYSAKNDTYTIRKGYFYTSGKTSKDFVEEVSSELNEAGIPFQIVNDGSLDFPFKGGAKISKQSHWYVEVKIDM